MAQYYIQKKLKDSKYNHFFPINAWLNKWSQIYRLQMRCLDELCKQIYPSQEDEVPG